MTDNLVRLIDNLSEFEKTFIIRRLNAMESGMNVHLGTLPFVNLELVRKALHFLPASSPNPEADFKKAKAILMKLGSTPKPETMKFRAHLNDQMVCKWSYGKGMVGRIMRLPFKKTVGAGIRWNHFKRQWEKPETQVHEQALMTRIEPGIWEIEVRKSLVEITKNYLIAQYGAGYQKIELKTKKTKAQKKYKW